MRKQNKKSGGLIFGLLCLTGLVIILALKLASPAAKTSSSKTSRPVFTPEAAVQTSGASNHAPESAIRADSIRSPYAILVRTSDHAVLVQKESDAKIYPASLTKIMTAIIAIENLPDLQQKIDLSPTMFQPLYQADASLAGFKPGEKVRALDLLYGALLPSGAECSIGLADAVSGSERSFAEKMNQKAQSLGMQHTHFTNATGLQNPDHYTTVRDLSVLLEYALQNKVFRSIFTSSRHSAPPTNKHPDGITFKSTLSRVLPDAALPNGQILGGKTGFTDDAGLCLASLARVGRQEYILVTAGAKGDHKTEQYDIDDAREVYAKLK